MKVLIVYAHPSPKSFNYTMLNTAQETLTQAGHIVQVSDLYDMKFNVIFDAPHSMVISQFKPELFEQFSSGKQTKDHLLGKLPISTDDHFFLQVTSEVQKVFWCDLIIWQFPVWWFNMPFILKSWVDCVFTTAYGIHKDNGTYEKGIFKGKKAMLSLTTGTVREMYQQNGSRIDVRDILRPLQRGILGFLGFDILTPNVVYAPLHLTYEKRKQVLVDYAMRLKRITEELPIEIGDD